MASHLRAVREDRFAARPAYGGIRCGERGRQSVVQFVGVAVETLLAQPFTQTVSHPDLELLGATSVSGACVRGTQALTGHRATQNGQAMTVFRAQRAMDAGLRKLIRHDEPRAASIQRRQLADDLLFGLRSVAFQFRGDSEDFRRGDNNLPRPRVRAGLAHFRMRSAGRLFENRVRAGFQLDGDCQRSFR